SLGAGRRGLEHVARTHEIHPARLLVVAEDDERQVDHHVRALHEAVDRFTVEDVTAHVARLVPVMRLRIESPPRHAADLTHLWSSLESSDERHADLPGRARDGNRELAIVGCGHAVPTLVLRSRCNRIYGMEHS